MARAASGLIKWNKGAMYEVINEGTLPLIEKATQIATDRANAMWVERTGLYHRDHKAPPVGNTEPVYASEVNKSTHYHHGIVYTANYAAMKDTKKHNTLLKAVPHV